MEQVLHKLTGEGEGGREGGWGCRAWAWRLGGSSFRPNNLLCGLFASYVEWTNMVFIYYIIYIKIFKKHFITQAHRIFIVQPMAANLVDINSLRMMSDSALLH